MAIDIFCGSCGAKGSVNRVTASLRCACGSDNLGLEGIDAKPSRVVRESAMQAEALGGTGWGKPMPSPTRGWSDYEGPVPATTPRSAPVSDAQVCPACNGSGYDLIDKTVCRECQGTGTVKGEHPTSKGNDYAHPESYDATTQGPPSGGARWVGASVGTGSSASWTMPGMSQTSVTSGGGGGATLTFTTPVTAARPSKADPYGTAEYQNQNYGPGQGRQPSPAVKERKQRDYSVPAGPYRMDEATCPSCGYAPTELRKDKSDSAWWHCPHCGPLANIDRHPEINPYAPPTDFTPDRGMKTSSLLGRTRKTGRLLQMLAMIHMHNQVSQAEAVGLARRTLLTYGEER